MTPKPNKHYKPCPKCQFNNYLSSVYCWYCMTDLSNQRENDENFEKCAKMLKDSLLIGINTTDGTVLRCLLDIDKWQDEHWDKVAGRTIPEMEKIKS